MPHETRNWIDVTQVGGLQEALDLLPPTGGAIYVPAGRHEIGQPVVKALQEGQHLYLVGDGRASALVNTNERGEDMLRITGVVGAWWPDLRITIRDLAFVGNHRSGDALVVDFPNDTMIDGCFFIGHAGQAVRLKSQGTNVTLRDCWMRDCKRGVRAENIHHLTLHGNQTRSVEGGQTQEEHVFLTWNCREVRIVNNHFAYGHNEAIVLDGTAQHVIANNTIEGFKVAIDARGVSDVNPRDRCRDITIASNYLHSPIGVHMRGECKGFAIQGNNFINNTHAAIRIEDAQGGGFHNIANNVVRKSVYDGSAFPLSHATPEQGGIYLGDAEDCVVTGNLLDGVRPGPAISAGPGGGRHLITSNRLVRCEGTGIDVRAPGCDAAHNLCVGNNSAKCRG